MFANAGWQVEDRKDFSPIQSAVAVREGLLVGNKEADFRHKSPAAFMRYIKVDNMQAANRLKALKNSLNKQS
jgi:hypothetical protein